eukprot:evm.model.scf_93.4 EVM.evm.TU.scf_93.4   scf_93:60767-67112(-)
MRPEARGHRLSMESHCRPWMDTRGHQAFTGLRLDLDKLRRDNEARTNVTRKNGLIINTGDKLTKKEKEQLRQDASAKYGLSAEDIAWADAELKKMQQKGAMAESTIPLEGLFLDAPTEDLDRTGRIALLGQLRKLLVEAMAAADRDKAQAAGRDVEPQDEEMCEAGDQMEQVQPDADLEEKENEKENVGMTSKSVKNQMAQDVHVEQFKQLDENQINGRLWPLAEITISGQGPCTRKRHSDGNGGSALSARTPAVRKKARQRSIWSPDAPSVGSDSLQADVDLGILTAMGYSKRHAQEALEENDNDVAAAANWLVMNCS